MIDSSSLISLSRAGLLTVIDLLPELPGVLDVVWREVVEEGLAGQHPDATAIDAALGAQPRQAAPHAPTVDQAVMLAAVGDGTLLANDLTLGRRARNLGARWIRTADLIVVLYRTGRYGRDEARGAIAALWSAGRITLSLRDEYLEALR